MGEIPMLLDTGADMTSVMPGSGLLSDTDYNRLTGERTWVRGVSGSIRAVRCWAHILFEEDDGAHRLYAIDVVVMPNQRRLRRLPSALGQDILSHWRLVHDPTAAQVYSVVLSADFTVRPP